MNYLRATKATIVAATGISDSQQLDGADPEITGI